MASTLAQQEKTPLAQQEKKRNRAKCLKCDSVIQSKSVHNFVRCACGECFVDGGQAYFRFGSTDLSLIFLMPYDDDEKNKEYNKAIVASAQKEEGKEKEEKEDAFWTLAPLEQ